jgi:hypothetical protein
MQSGSNVNRKNKKIICKKDFGLCLNRGTEIAKSNKQGIKKYFLGINKKIHTA